MSIDRHFYHFSVDDVFESLIEVSDRKIELFQHPFFRFLKEIHDKFNTHVDLYLFFQAEIKGEVRTLKEVPNLRKVLKNNPWIRFGPHALDYATGPYTQKPEEQQRVFESIYGEILRFAGSQNMSRIVRLHFFSESYELAKYFRERGVTALFTTDKERIASRLPEENKKELVLRGLTKFGGLELIRSQIRIENFVENLNQPRKIKELGMALLEKYGFVIIFTHEREISNLDTRNVTLLLIESLYKAGVSSV